MVGIAPEIYFCDTRTGSQFVEFIESDTMSNEDFNTRPEVVKAAARSMNKINNSKRKFKTLLNPMNKIKEYEGILSKNGFKERYKEWQMMSDILEKIREAYRSNPPEIVPCHNDALAENFMFDGEVMHVIDWEYSSMGCRFYDFCCIFAETYLCKKHEELFLKTYFDGKLTEEILARTLINKFLVNAHWSTWSLVQIASGKDYDFYWPYGKTRAVECDKFANDSNFERYLELIK